MLCYDVSFVEDFQSQFWDRNVPLTRFHPHSASCTRGLLSAALRTVPLFYGLPSGAESHAGDPHLHLMNNEEEKEGWNISASKLKDVMSRLLGRAEEDNYFRAGDPHLHPVNEEGWYISATKLKDVMSRLLGRAEEDNYFRAGDPHLHPVNEEGWYISAAKLKGIMSRLLGGAVEDSYFCAGDPNLHLVNEEGWYISAAKLRDIATSINCTRVLWSKFTHLAHLK